MSVKGGGRAACPPFAFHAVASCSMLLCEVACGSRLQPEERRADDSALRLALPRDDRWATSVPPAPTVIGTASSLLSLDRGRHARVMSAQAFVRSVAGTRWCPGS